MIPLIPALILAFVSFLASAFVVLRIIIPILPPSPLSKRVAPAEFGLPQFRSLSPSDKGHIWLAGLDITVVFIFVWHVTAEATSGPVGAAMAQDPLSTIRLWFIMTARQTCLLGIAGLTLLHVRMGRPISFGKKHWMLWAPVVLLAVTSTTLAGVLSGAGVIGLFPGLIAYTGTFAVLTTVLFACLFITLFTIKKNLAAINAEQEGWPEVEEEEKMRGGFSKEDIDRLRDGASWISSTSGGSCRNSMSAWSFSTHQTAVASNHSHNRPSSRNHGSVPAKSSFWFNAVNNDNFIPPVPPLPSYGLSVESSDPFRKGDPDHLRNPRPRVDSQTSWLTSTDGSRTTLPPWDFPPSVYEASIYNASTQDLQTMVQSRTTTPGLATAQVLGGYGYSPNASAETGLASLATTANGDIRLSSRPVIGWSLSTWLPFTLALPYLVILSQQATTSAPVYVLYFLSVTLSAPLLALSLLFDAGLPLPVGIFDSRPTAAARRLSASVSELEVPQYKWSNEFKRSIECKRSLSTTPTVVEGRRSGDVWISKGNAKGNTTKLGRAMSMLKPNPKLSVMPPDDDDKDSLKSPPIPIVEGDSSIAVHVHNRSRSECSAQFGRLRTQSKSSSYYASATEEADFASRIMTAQRHFSTLAKTMLFPAGSSDSERASIVETVVGSASGVVTKKQTGSNHLRTRSTSSVGPLTPSASVFGSDISLPPPFPLPPTPPSVRAIRLVNMRHKKSFSSSYYTPRRPVTEAVNEIDALSASVLPYLVPGLKIGDDMKVTDDAPLGTWSKHKGMKMAAKQFEESVEFSSPEAHSTLKKDARNRKQTHKKNHRSLPSIGHDTMQSLTNGWSNEAQFSADQTEECTAVDNNAEDNRRNTFGIDMASILESLRESEDTLVSGPFFNRESSTRASGLNADVPHSISESARSSMLTIHDVPTSASSADTLFEEFEAGLYEYGARTHSTPHSSIRSVKPRGSGRRESASSVYSKRASSIVYIRSDDNLPNELNDIPESYEPGSVPSTVSSITSWSTRAVQPLVPRAGSFKRKSIASKAASVKENAPGLRRLSLLQDRDNNSIHSVSQDSISTNSVRSLNFTKKRAAASASDENAAPEAVAPRAGGKNLKPLKLARSETAKARGILRKTEKLPQLVIRPPSNDYTPYNAY